MVDRPRLTPVLCAAIGAAIGFYCSASVFPPWLFVVLFFLIAALCLLRVLVSVCVYPRFLRLLSVCTVALTCGLFLGMCAASAGRNNVSFGLSEDRITAIEGVLLEDPRIISEGRAMAVLSLQRSAASGGVRTSSRGKITVFFPQESAIRLREFGRGTTVFTEGRLRKTETGWTYSAESMHVVKRAGTIDRMRTGTRLNLIGRFDGKPWGGLALALLLGIRDNLDTNLAALYRDAGCSYILALSGMHLAVLAFIITLLLKKPLGLKASAVTGAVIILLYCFLVGPMPSLYRAALMYLLGVIAILGSLPREPMSILALSFLIQIIATPAAGNSLSFVLSYLALAGILIIGQPLYSLFAGKLPDFLLQPLSASCGAFLATAGVTCFAFGVLVPMGIVTGLFLVPLTTVFMTGSMLYLALDIVKLSGFLSAPLNLLYRLMERIVTLAGSVHGITSANPSVVLAMSILLSVLILAFVYRQRALLLRLRPFP